MHWAGNLKIDTVCPTGWFKLASLGYTTLSGIIIVGSIMGDSKVGRLKTAIVGGLLATVTASSIVGQTHN